MTIRRSILALSLMGASALLGGCSSEPIGTWVSREKLPTGKRNKLVVEEDKSGSLTMYIQITPADGVIPLKYDLKDWFLEADGQYEMQLKCTGGCEAGVNVQLDFDMDCEYDDSLEELNCTAGAPFASYGFLEFELREEE
jgi:hypothetical protein